MRIHKISSDKKKPKGPVKKIAKAVEISTANKKLKITNEKLKAANKALQTANKEINLSYSELKAVNKALEARDEALRKSEANINALLSNTVHAFILIDAENRVLTFNQVAHDTFKNVFGKKIEVGDSFNHLISKDLSHYFSEEIELALKGKTVIKEKEIRNLKGQRFGYIISCKPVLDKNKKVQALSFSLLDITELKNTRDELRKSQELISSVFHTTDIGIAILDDKGRYMKTNDGFNKLLGCKSGELDGRLYTFTNPPRLKKESRVKLNQLFSGENGSGEYQAIKKNGEVIYVFQTAKLLLNKDGSKYLVITVRDITELVHAREAEKIKDSLEEQQKLFRSIASSFPDGIIGVLDKRLHYVFAGGSEIKKLGLTADQLIGKNLFDQLSDKSNDSAVPFLKKAIAGESVIFEAGMRGQIYSVNAVPLMGDDGGTTQILVVLYNITQRKKAEEEVIGALVQQRELNELKSKFVSIASHEFRTPLSAILSSTFLISKYSQSNEQEKAQKHIDRIETAVRTLTDILNDFLSLGRIEEGKLGNNVSEFNVVQFCDTLIDEVQPTLKKGQSIVYHHEGEVNIFSLDRQHLRNILVNLLSNAAKYSAEGKNIWLTSACKKGKMQFSVKDEGIGIPASDQPRLFQTFFRAYNAANIQGTGMGLHIVKRFLDIMGGTIHFTSEENKGSTFIIEFPDVRQ